MAQISPCEVGGRNVVAFLDMIAHSEGTDNGRQKTMLQGYDVLVGGSLLTDYRDHPRKLVWIPSIKNNSSAAGRYQFLRGTWDEVAKAIGLKDFSPRSQDLACIYKIRQRGGLQHVIAGHFDLAVQACRKEWASLPGAGYGQHEQPLAVLRKKYTDAGGQLA